MNDCRYCGKSVPQEEAVKTLSYWKSVEFVCHKACKATGEKQEALDCQIIDADCNDCRHYRRGKLAEKVISTWINIHGKLATVIHQPNVFVGGWCLKFDRETLAQPNKWSGFECFEHRRA